MASGELDPCPACLGRREFIGSAALTLLLAACGDGQIGASGADLPTGGTTGFVMRIADYPALATVGGVARVDTPSGPVAVVRTGTNSFAALSMRCPHQGTTVRIEPGRFVCPNHGAAFAIDGTWTGGQRTSAMAAVPSLYDAASGTLTLSPSGGGGGGGGGGGEGDDDDDDDGGDDD